jgi:hypothetical protein
MTMMMMIIQFLYLSASLKRVAYNRRALKVYIKEARPELELEAQLEPELDWNLIQGNKIIQLTR